jgi:Zn-dependent protease with chaperone function
LYPVWRRILLPLRAGIRATALLACGLLAPLLALQVAVLLERPHWSGRWLPHCHGDQCSPHAAHVSITSDAGAGLLGVLLLSLGVGGVLLLLRLLRGRRWLRALQQLTRVQPAYRLVESDQRLAWCAGLWRPRIYLSQGLVRTLSTAELEVVIAHEHCHARRRDNLQRLLLQLATALWWPAARRALRADFARAAETVCDLHVLQTDAARPLLIQVITRLEPAAGVAARLAALDPHHRQPWRDGGVALILLAVLWVAQVLLFSSLGHPLLEWLTASRG